MSKVEAPNCVTIFGAGVAGLTAAHELVERGFRVQVWEKETDQRYPWRGCAVGGMARTQWSRIHWPETRDASDPWPRIEPLGVEMRWLDAHVLDKPHFAAATPVADGGGWIGVVQDAKLPASLEHALDTLIPQLTLEDEEPFLDVVVHYRLTKNLVPVEHYDRLTPSQRDELDAAFNEQERLAVRKAVEFLELVPGFDAKHSHIARRQGNAMKVRIMAEPDPEWIYEVTEATFRLEFFYTPPWGQPTAPIQHLSQKFYFKRLVEPEAKQPEAPEQVAKGPRVSPRFGHLHDQVATDVPVSRCRESYRLRALGSRGATDPAEVVQEFVGDLKDATQVRHVYVEVADRRWWDAGPAADDTWDLELASCIQQEFKRLLQPSEPSELLADHFPWDNSRVYRSPDHRALYSALRLPNGRIVVFTAVRLQAFPYEDAPGVDIVMQFRVRERWLPGEHGYRFFPAFYHHLFDTMRRTPILEPVNKSAMAAAQERAVYVTPDPAKYVESFRVVFDNLRSQRFTALAFADGKRPALVNRFALDSVEGALDAFKTLVGAPEEGGVGFNTRDWTRFSLRCLQYLSSGAARRREYERISWWDFVEADSYAPNSQKALERFPKALVAMDAVEGDARTIGSSGCQTLLDQFKRSSEFRDGTLRGPTSEAWFKYWRSYLEAQGVEFIHGKLVGLSCRECADGGSASTERVWPDVECYEPRFTFENVGREGELDLRPCLMPGYFVLALSADEVQRVASDFYARHSRNLFPHRDLERAADLELGDPTQVVPDGELRHFAGIQYYFEEDTVWIDGHVYLPHSNWAITSISQARFWEDRQDWEHGYRGILSAIIGKWDVPGNLLGKRAWDCTPDELAREVWYQLSEAMEEHPSTRLFDGRLPRPLFWHLDDSVSYDKDRSPRWQNKTPFQIQTPGRYQQRPGDLDRLGYSTEFGIGLCGTYCKTHTRITSMEAANESGRHLTNAILRDVASPFRRTPCDIFPIESREVQDFEFFKEVDDDLCARGLPHLLEIIGIDRVLSDWWPDSELLVGNPLQMVERYRELVRHWLKSQGSAFGR